MAGAKVLYSGNCAESWTVKQCQTAGLDPGSLHRADSYSESNVTLVLQAEKDKCDAMVSAADRLRAQTDPVFAESLRMWVQQCAAPDGGTWETGY